MTLNQHSNEFREQAQSCLLMNAGLLPQGAHIGGKSPFHLKDLQRGHVKSQRGVKYLWIFMLVLRRDEEPYRVFGLLQR